MALIKQLGNVIEKREIALTILMPLSVDNNMVESPKPSRHMCIYSIETGPFIALLLQAEDAGHKQN